MCAVRYNELEGQERIRPFGLHKFATIGVTMHESISNRGLSAFGKGAIWATFVAIAFSLMMAIGVAAPSQALAAGGGEELTAGSMQTTAAKVMFADGLELWAGNSRDVELYRYVDYTGDTQPTFTKVVSSDPSVLKVKKLDSEKTIWSYSVYPMKAGKAKLSVTYKLNGTTKTISKTFTVEAFSDGVKSITLNGEQMPIPTSTRGMTELNLYEFKGTSVTLDVATANGWVVESVYGYVTKIAGSSSKYFDVTLGKPFAMKNGYEGDVDINLYKESTDEYFTYRINFYREKAITLSKETFYAGHPKYNLLPTDMISGGTENIEVTKVASSKPSVLKPVFNKNIEKVKLQAKKPGKCKVTVTYKIDGRTYSVSAAYQVLSYPLKSVKVNGKAVKLTKHDLYYYLGKYKKSSAKVSFVAAKGWKVVSIKRHTLTGKAKTAKNGATISTPNKDITTVSITLKKGKVRFVYSVSFNRGASVYGGDDF